MPITSALTDCSDTSRRKYSFKLTPRFSADIFCQWTPGETRKIEYGLSRKPRGKEKSRVTYKPWYIPTPYVQLVSQFMHENAHGLESFNFEAQHCGSYAGCVLEALGVELDACPTLVNDGPHAWKWRSTVLTPILQRHIYGIPDTIASWVHSGIVCVLKDPPSDENSNDGGNEDGGGGGDDDDDERELTISDMTRFYLGADPLDPSVIPTLCRNLVLIREARWHLAVVLEKASIHDAAFFVKTIESQDFLLDPPEGQLPDVPQTNLTDVPPFTPAELEVLRDGRLTSFYTEATLIYPTYAPTDQFLFPPRSQRMRHSLSNLPPILPPRSGSSRQRLGMMEIWEMTLAMVVMKETNLGLVAMEETNLGLRVINHVAMW